MKWWALAVLVPFVAACGEEGPIEVGAGLLPPDAIRTFELVLEPERFLVFDTAFGLYTEPQDADFMIVANQFEDALQARGLARFNMPTALNVIDTLGIGRLDTVPRFVAGTVRMQVDTVRSTDAPVRVALYRTVENWDISATWTLRSDEPGARQPWATPGGTLGVLVDSMTLAAGSDSVSFRVDSATLALWADTANAARGVLIVLETAGGRVRTSLPVLHLDVRSGFRPDTLHQLQASAPTHTFIFTPEQPTVAADPRVGGTPGWRTVFRIRERLDTLTFACPGVPNCRFRLGEANLNYAALRLQPRPAPPGFHPEGSQQIAAYLLLPAAQVPLQRSPLGDPIGFVSVPAATFRATDAAPVDLAITELMRAVSMDPARRPTDFVATHFALVSGEPRNFGFGTFASMPALRLVVSITRELQLP